MFSTHPNFDVLQEEIQHLKGELENAKEECYYLKHKLETKRDIIVDMEIELTEFETKFKDAKEAVVLKEIEIDEQERCINQQTEAIQLLKSNHMVWLHKSLKMLLWRKG